MEYKVIDVSKHQGKIDWEKVKASGIYGAILRCSYGTDVSKQQYFKTNADACTKLNIPFGIYLYSCATTLTDVKKQATLAINLAKPYKLSLPIYFDSEMKGTEGISLKATQTFCSMIKNAGYEAGVYCSNSWFNSFIKNTKYSIWIARYGGKKPSISQSYDGWQYTSTGKVSGINGNVDISIFYKTFEKKEDSNMSIIFGSARSSETGGINGVKGDQKNGAEVSTQNYYLHSKGWYVLRAKNQTHRTKIAKAMKDACANDNIGYGQSDRLSAWNQASKVGYDTSKIGNKCNVDCSELVRICVRYGTGKDVGDIYTGNLKSSLLSSGLFDDVTSSVNANNGSGLYNGDILVTKTKGHTGVIVSGGKGTSVSSTATNTTSSVVKATGSAAKRDVKYSKTYTTTANLYMRNDGDKSALAMTILPKGTSCKNYGYYDVEKNGTVWLYVSAVVDGKTYEGFCSKKYLV